MRKYFYRWIILFVLVFLSSCSGTLPTVMVSRPTGISTESSGILPFTPTITLTPLTPTLAATSPPTPTLPGTATITPTPDPYEIYTIDYLAGRRYGGGSINIEEIIADNSYFTRYLISYPSDGLTIYGFMNVPKKTEPPYPVVIALHGYIDPEIYTTLDYTTGYADTISRAGFIVIHPNLRNYPPSDSGDNLFRVGMAEDVLNLIGIIESQASQAGSLEHADPDAIGIWGHSMGGGVSLRVITVSPKIKGAVLYGAMSGDEERNFAAIYRWSDGQRGLEELTVPTEELVDISPIFYLDRIQVPVSIHHGEADALVPIQWSLELCDELKKIGKTVECFTYPDQPHTFNGEGEATFNQRVIDFFTQTLTQK